MDYDKEFPSKYVYLPTMGQTATFKIKTIKKAVSNNPKFNFTEIERIELPDGTEAETKKNLGYHIECELQDSEQILSVTGLGSFLSVFKKHNIQDGDTVVIEHPEKGVWKVEKL
jgi:hypothetical protein